jgi:hypothetical protein
MVSSPFAAVNATALVHLPIHGRLIASECKFFASSLLVYCLFV